MKYETRATGVAVLAAFLAVTACESSAAVSRHAVGPIELTPENVAHQNLYVARCDDCHDKRPDPSEPYCFTGVSADDHLAIWEYEMAMLNDDPEYSEASKALFETTCVGCHDLPDPAQPGCFSGVSSEDVIPIHVFMENSRKGRDVFDADCRSCHEELDPGLHDFEFWSRHMCNADEHLSLEDEQQVLLYLAVHAQRAETGP